MGKYPTLNQPVAHMWPPFSLTAVSPTSSAPLLRFLGCAPVINLKLLISLNRPVSNTYFYLCLDFHSNHIVSASPLSKKVSLLQAVSVSRVKLTGDPSWTLHALGYEGRRHRIPPSLKLCINIEKSLNSFSC